MPEAESTHLLLIRSLFAETFTVGSKTVVAVAMVSSSLLETFEEEYSGGRREARKVKGADRHPDKVGVNAGTESTEEVGKEARTH